MTIILAPPNLLEHPAFRGIKGGSYFVPAGFSTDGLGQRHAVRFDSTLDGPRCRVDREDAPGLPWAWLHEEIFEWMAVAEAVQSAGPTFTMVELGAGYGRWLVAAATIARNVRPDVVLTLIGVEAEPTHFRWMQEHFENNGLDCTKHELIEAAISDRDGTIEFIDGTDASGDYGQHVASTAAPEFHRSAARIAPAVSINGILDRHETVDLVDMDIQGFERVVVPAGIERMTAQVKRASISIHEPTKVAEEVRNAFAGAGWRNRYDFPVKSEIQTEFGMISFNDGIQYWENPRLL